MISFIALNSPEALDQVVQQYCPGNEAWNSIVGAERELREIRQSMDDRKTPTIAYEISNGTEILGLIDYYHAEAGFLKKERIEINVLTLCHDSPAVVREIHQTLVRMYKLSGNLIHVISLADENAPNC